MPEGIANADVSEIEITPEMIETGVSELYCHPIMEPTDDVLAEAVKAVFCRMLEVQRQNVRAV